MREGKLAVVHYVEGHSRLEYPIGNVLYQKRRMDQQHPFFPAWRAASHSWIIRRFGTIAARSAVVDLAGHVRTLSQRVGVRSWSWPGARTERRFGSRAVEKGNNLNLMAVDLVRQDSHLAEFAGGDHLAGHRPRRPSAGYSELPNVWPWRSTGLGAKEDVELSWHDWNSARDISRDGQFVLFEDASEAAGPGYAVALRKVDGTLPMRLGEGSSGGLSPDGKWAISVSPKVKPRRITLLPIGAGQPRSINVTGLAHIHNGWARFLPDGQRLIGEWRRDWACAALLRGRSVQRKSQSRSRRKEFCAAHLRPTADSMVGIGPNPADGYLPRGRGAPAHSPSGTRFNPVQWSNDGALFTAITWANFPARFTKSKSRPGKKRAFRN